MAKQADLELKKAFAELQTKMLETHKKIQIIDSQIQVLNRASQHVGVTRESIGALPPGTKTYEAVARMFLAIDPQEMARKLKLRESNLSARTIDLQNNKMYLEKTLKESENNIREMVQQRKGQY